MRTAGPSLGVAPTMSFRLSQLESSAEAAEM